MSGKKQKNRNDGEQRTNYLRDQVQRLSKMNKDLVTYYKDRANEYEKIYALPERQEDLAAATALLKDLFRDKEVFEIACGTGYWTERIAETARSIFATDINQNVIELAEKKKYPANKVTFAVADLFEYRPPKKYETLFAGFIWSHIPLQDLDRFVRISTNFVAPGGMLVLMDNNYVPESNRPITHRDEWGNTYQARTLDDGSAHLVLKNFPIEEFLWEKWKNTAARVEFYNLKYYWILACILPHSPS